MDIDTYKKEYIRMMDSLRDSHKGNSDCEGVKCTTCPLGEICRVGWMHYRAMEIVQAVDKWSRENLDTESEEQDADSN